MIWLLLAIIRACVDAVKFLWEGWLGMKASLISTFARKSKVNPQQFMLVLLALLGVTLMSCESAPKSAATRLPAQSTEQEEEQYVHTHFDPQERSELEAVPQFPNPNAERLRQLFLGIRTAQVLVSSFDYRKERLLAPGNLRTTNDVSQAYDRLAQSNLYCKIQDVRKAHHSIERKLLEIAKSAYRSGTESRDWFFSQLNQYAMTNKAAMAGMAQLARLLVQQEASICGQPGCVGAELPKLSGFTFELLNEQAFASFLTENRREISLYATATNRRGDVVGFDSDLRRGDCMLRLGNREPQQAGFSWRNQDWMNGNLAQGEFVFTYDDGPHRVHTVAIRDSFARAGLAKPTFFWVAGNVRRLPELSREFVASGYAVGSHSERHVDLGNIAKAQSSAQLNRTNQRYFQSIGESTEPFATWKLATLDREIVRSASTIEEVIRATQPGYSVTMFRLPYGSGRGDPLIAQRFQRIGVDHFFWRIDSYDWQDKNPQSIANRVWNDMQKTRRGMILFHDIHSQSAQATQILVDRIRASSEFRVVPISKMLAP